MIEPSLLSEFVAKFTSLRGTKYSALLTGVGNS